MKPNCLTPKSCHACAWRSVLQNKTETRLNRKRAIGIKLASRHVLSRPDQIGDKEKVADDLPLMSASCAKEAARCREQRAARIGRKTEVAARAPPPPDAIRVAAWIRCALRSVGAKIA